MVNMVNLTDQKVWADGNESYAEYELEGETVRITELYIDETMRGSEEAYRFVERFAEYMQDNYNRMVIEIDPQSVDDLNSDNYLKNHLADRVVEKSTVVIDL